MKNKNNLIAGIVIAVLIIAVVLISISPKQEGDEETIEIGFIGPLSGNVAFLGSIDEKATNLAVEEINNKGGVNGKQLEVVFQDGKCTGEGGLSAANKLINFDNINILLVSCGQEVLTVAPIAEENQVILFATYATHPDISNLGDFIFRNSYSDTDIAEIATDTIIKKHKKIGLISEQTDYTIGLRDAFKVKFEESEGVIIEEYFESGSTDFKTELLKLINLDAIFINPSGLAQGELILKQLEELNYNGDLYGNYFGGSNKIQQIEKAQDMIYFSDPTSTNNEKKKQYFTKYKTTYQELPDLEFPAVARYDAVYILVQAIDSCNSDDPDCIRDYLYDLENFEGVLGNYSFDENGDLEGIQPSVNIIKNKEAVKYEK